MTTSLTGRACNLFSLERLKKSHGTRVIYAIHNRAAITFPSEELRQPAPLAANAGKDVPLLIQNGVRIIEEIVLGTLKGRNPRHPFRVRLFVSDTLQAYAQNAYAWLISQHASGVPPRRKNNANFVHHG